MTFDINTLKKVKVPIWARWLGAIRAWQRRRNAHKEVYYIGTVFSWIHWTDSNTYSKRWYICKVDGAGRRFFEYNSDQRLLKDYRSDPEYARIIVPWQYGRFTNAQIEEYAKKTEKVSVG